MGAAAMRHLIAPPLLMVKSGLTRSASSQLRRFAVGKVCAKSVNTRTFHRLSEEFAKCNVPQVLSLHLFISDLFISGSGDIRARARDEFNRRSNEKEQGRVSTNRTPQSQVHVWFLWRDVPHV